MESYTLLRVSYGVPFIRADQGLLWAVKQTKMSTFYGFTEFWGNREEEGGGHTHPQIKLPPGGDILVQACERPTVLFNPLVSVGASGGRLVHVGGRPRPTQIFPTKL